MDVSAVVGRHKAIAVLPALNGWTAGRLYGCAAMAQTLHSHVRVRMEQEKTPSQAVREAIRKARSA